MSVDGATVSPADDARLALKLLAVAPKLGGVTLRGDWSIRDELVAYAKPLFPQNAPWQRLPLNLEPGQLQGGVDLVASLASGRRVISPGILDKAAGGVIVAPMADRMPQSLAGPIAQFLDDVSEHRPTVLIMLDDGIDVDERPPAALIERAAFCIDLTGAAVAGQPQLLDRELDLAEVAQLSARDREALANVSVAFGVASGRALRFAELAARAHAASNERRTVEEIDLATACRLVLAPRATRLPAPNDLPQDEPDRSGDRPNDADDNFAETASRDILLEAVAAAIPPKLLDQIGKSRTRRRVMTAGGGQRGQSAARGRPLASHPGLPRGGHRLALIDTLRAAVPWQGLRRQEAIARQSLLQVRKADLRIRRFEERSVSLTIFCVDASGSAAVARLAEAKGAVERLLAQAYVTRSEVALISFRGENADLLLPPTRSLTRARRVLSDLPGGGGTPLASGIAMARQVGKLAAGRGRGCLIVLLTDGSANVALDGTGGRTKAHDDAIAAAQSVAEDGIDALVIDISARPRQAAQELAQALKARYVPLPAGRSDAIDRAVRTALAS